jgi:Ca2+/Na+ antiporter
MTPQMDRTTPASGWSRLATTVGIGLLAAICTYPWWHGVSPWAGAAFFVAAAAVADMPRAALEMAPFPHFAILIAALQYGLAPLASHYYTSDTEYQIASFTRYFAYGGPVLLAVALGWTVSFLGLSPGTTASPRQQNNPSLARELDWLLWGGMLFNYFGSGFGGGGLAFVVVLLGNLRYLGAIGWMILAKPGWKGRVMAVLAYEVISANRSGMFHDFILWALSLLGVYMVVRRLKVTAFIAWLAAVVAFVFFLQDAKWEIRQATWFGGNQVTVFGRPVALSPWTRPFVSVLCVADSACKLFIGGYTEESLDYSITRFNQGWIIDCVLQRVPHSEPFARGETIFRALEASFLPRVLAPNKLQAGGRENMERFAGRTLTEETSMNLGFAGEMYANFGYLGGVVGCGIYALVLGLLCRWIATRARISPSWWAIAAYAGHWALKAETDVGSVMNYVTKASLIVFAVTLCLPALRAELRGQRSEGRGQRSERRGQRSDARRRDDKTARQRDWRPETSDQRPEIRGQKAEGRSKRWKADH